MYDGYTTRDPIILKFCGGGQALPASISSGPELLVEFTTSPFGVFTKPHPNNINSLNGFQLEVSSMGSLLLLIDAFVIGINPIKICYNGRVVIVQ